jgi:hypothetical protein
MLLNDVRMATLAKALVGAVAKGPPEGVGAGMSEDFIRGTQRGVMMTVLPLLLLASDDRIDLDDFVATSTVTLPPPVLESLKNMVLQLRKMLADDPCPEEMSPHEHRVMTFSFMDTLKLVFRALFEAADNDHAEHKSGIFAAVSAIIYALSDRFDVPMAELCQSLGVPEKYQRPMIDAADTTNALHQAQQA